MGNKKQLSDSQLTLFQAVFDNFNKTGEWPNSIDLNVKLRNMGDLWQNAESIGFDYIDAQQHRDPCFTTLTAFGISYCKGSKSILSLFVTTVKYCVKRYVDNPQDPKITGTELMTELKIEHDDLKRLVQILRSERRFSASHNNATDPYSFEMTLSKEILKYENIRDIDDYIEIAYPWAFREDNINNTPIDNSNIAFSIWDKDAFIYGLEDDQTLSMHDVLKSLHPEIYEKCHRLFLSLHFSEAVEKGFKVVKNKLRSLTGYERASDATGVGKLHIKGAVAAHVDADFNQAVKFLLMSIDFFRNEAFHSLDSRIDEPSRAYEYLSLCSLAMNLLEDAEVMSDVT